MLILQRYILKRFLITLFYCSLVFISLYIIVDLFDNIDEIIEQKWTLLFLLRYYGNYVPLIFTRTIPVAALLSSLHSLGNLEKTNEIIPIKTAGINFVKTIIPILFWGIIISLGVFIINEKVVSSMPAPLFQEKKEILYDVTLYGDKNQIFYLKEYDTQKNIAKDIIIFIQDKNKQIRQKITAKKTEWINNRWNFFDLTISKLNLTGEIIGESARYEQKIIDIGVKPIDFLNSAKKIEFMSSRELKRMIGRLSSVDYKPQRELTEWHYKISFPWINMVIIFLGLSFGMASKGKGGIFVRIGISLLLGLSYYGVISISLALGKGGFLIPSISAWLPHFLFLIISFGVLRKNL
ncbi:MAG: LptF/LptG family permease [Candidatus Omnitrophica bacterium]|nr:LptF/LptG family permease [Candidatus Omnitrophota bacterium]